MDPEFDIRPTVQAHSAIPIERLRVVSRFDDLHLPQIRRGIVFVLAAWSGPAVLGLRKFTEAIVEHVTDSLDLVVIDIDCLSQEAIAALFGSSGFPVGGNGETVWVKDGVVVDREIAASCASSTILENTKGYRMKRQPNKPVQINAVCAHRKSVAVIAIARSSRRV